MEPIAERKVHFAPFARQAEAIDALVQSGDVRNVTELMRRALDHYLAARGRPSLVQQAQMMAEDFADSERAGGARTTDVTDAQGDSMATDEASSVPRRDEI